MQPFYLVILLGNSGGYEKPWGSGVRVHKGRGRGHSLRPPNPLVKGQGYKYRGI